jgi:S-adenosyl-L-methionine hydrolase (adenosine-forming)
MVTLLTDFGIKDPYAAMMKGVILSMNPRASIIDISHQVPAGAVSQAAWILRETYPYFPKGTVHVAVVDPGVGTERRGIVAVIGAHLFVGPDNGIFWPMIEASHEARVIHLCNGRYFLQDVSATFHGRDIFAPVAGRLSQGADPFHMGPIIHDPVPLKTPVPGIRGGSLYGRVIRVDRFGNLISNIRRMDMEGFLKGGMGRIRIGDLCLDGLHKTYGQVPAGEPVALFGSSGYLEIAVNRGRAVDRTGVAPGEIIDREIEVSQAAENGHHS